ncbi:efflux RND transporter permease subunit [Aureimonas phyllosphaerae]|uniref:Efflux pump membrane transporter n=1 Tax=Aureimonas phyllosphaerae TaxID=1166078 RepID=A0A7W6BPZ0_9HYPH|nr:efflux RND transporter permease subunit [Aureimonas phyllosphaerae]MBB3934130.1 multidrug efflux pump [Aureimonas phyllosphaerae]MBB3958654.1 multidrug efflux pump [Aureimonas phyllosphaerae]SFF00236.1 multidrug efflux pump [Aureimonas phyllosphaerae]
MAQFFIRRPVFAWVIAIAIMLGGLLGLYQLSISRYPDIAPPNVRISATYPGASAQTLENSVTKIIEQNMTGLDGLLYMASNSTSAGSASITLTFQNGTDPDIAQVQTQNKLAQVTSQLPEAVQRQGLTVSKSSSGILMVAALTSANPRYSSIDLADLVSTNLEDAIRRVPGVGDLNLFGSGYAMRVWLDPAKLAQFQLTPGDVTSAIGAQNSQVSVGQLGATPSAPGAQMNFTITSQSQLQTPDQFRSIILKTATDGSLVTIGDVARVEIGAESYNTSARYNGQPAAGFGVNLAAGANAIDTAEGVVAAMERLKGSLPSDVEIVYPNDTTPFVKLSIEKVVHTLIEAVVLVFVVMLLFLQNWRATLIPTIAVPVVLLGTLGVLAVAGYSINTLTMFAMVLAIGLLVDDAIVVVENVERVMEEEGLGPREATEKSMREITGALVGIALVLSAVFLPMAFFGGSVGIIYQQFSITIVTAMLLSVVVAVVLTPALCATLLKPAHGASKNWFFRGFNRGFGALTNGYERATGGLLARPLRVLFVFLLICGGTAYLFNRLPSSFLPPEDQGVLMTQIELPVGATRARTIEVLSQVEQYYLTQEATNVEGVFATQGFSFGGQGQNLAMAFVRLKPFDERTADGQDSASIAGRAMRAFAKIRDARVVALSPPALPGLGQSGGFELYLQDSGGQGPSALADAGQRLLQAAGSDPILTGVRRNGTPTQPQLDVEIDHQMAGALGIDVAAVNDVLSKAWAGAYVNDFDNNGRIKPVYVQADAPFRMLPSDLNRWYARNDTGEMVPFSAFTQVGWDQGPARLERFNGLSAVNIQGQAASGTSSGEAMARMEQLVADLGPGWTVDWSGLSYQERLSGSQAPLLYALSVLVVFLCLAALYESWTVPFSVILAVPIGVFGALVAASMSGLSNDIYFKVGLLTTIGLAAKNAILIVEFARDLHAAGKPLVEATLEAARLRLRPILMTSFAFILGVLPLAISTGAGAGVQRAIGIGVMGGMIAATALGIFFVPLFFAAVMRVSAGLSRRPAAPPLAPEPAE